MYRYKFSSNHSKHESIEEKKDPSGWVLMSKADQIKEWMFGSYLLDLAESGLICQETAIFVLQNPNICFQAMFSFLFLLTFIATWHLCSNSVQSSKDFHTYDCTREIALIASFHGHESRERIKQALSVKLHSTSFSPFLFFVLSREVPSSQPPIEI